MTASRSKNFKFKLPFKVRKWFAPVDKPLYVVDPKLAKCLRSTTLGLVDWIISGEQGHVSGDGFWYLPDKGTAVRPLLVAHVDTVCTPMPPRRLCLDKEMLYNPEGILGADDRAGVYAALMLREKTGIGVLLCDEEERGAHGARSAGRNIGSLIQAHPYMLELDRQGHRQVVYYRDECEAFMAHMTSHGFIKDRGSFSDISVLSTMLDVPGANVSIGFNYQHSKNEFLDLRTLEDTIERVTRLIETNEVVEFTPVKTWSARYDQSYGSKRWWEKSGKTETTKWDRQRREFVVIDGKLVEQKDEPGLEEEELIDLDKISDEEIGDLDLNVLTDEEIDNLSAEQINRLSVDQIEQLTFLQVTRYDDEKLAAIEDARRRERDEALLEQGDDPDRLYEWWHG